jgi:hypothetical protein
MQAAAGAVVAGPAMLREAVAAAQQSGLGAGLGALAGDAGPGPPTRIMSYTEQAQREATTILRNCKLCNISMLDPDIEALRSVSRMAKLQMQRRRLIQRSYEDCATWREPDILSRLRELLAI